MTTKKTAASKPQEPRRSTHGYDGAGHMDPRHAEHLLALSREDRSSDNEAAFIDSTSTEDDLAEGLAEAAVASMTSGEEELMTRLAAEVDEETGGPFTETSANVEFAGGTDESNIAEATREPFPTANRAGGR
jgi:hypothetical protein